jgi:hypothetical protein
MSLEAIKCPQCGANIEVNTSVLFFPDWKQCITVSKFVVFLCLALVSISGCNLLSPSVANSTPTPIATLDIATSDCSRLMKTWFFDQGPLINKWNQVANEGLDNEDRITDLKLLIKDFSDHDVPICGAHIKTLFITALGSDIRSLEALWEHNLSESEFGEIVNEQTMNHKAFRQALEEIIGPLETETPQAYEEPTLVPGSTDSSSDDCEVAALAWSAIASPMSANWNELQVKVLDNPDRLGELVKLKEDIDSIPAAECVRLAQSLLSESMQYVIEAITAIKEHKSSEADIYALLDKSDQKYSDYLVEFRRIINYTE